MTTTGEHPASSRSRTPRSSQLPAAGEFARVTAGAELAREAGRADLVEQFGELFDAGLRDVLVGGALASGQS